jgi:hypothetical protein
MAIMLILMDAKVMIDVATVAILKKSYLNVYGLHVLQKKTTNRNHDLLEREGLLIQRIKQNEKTEHYNPAE